MTQNRIADRELGWVQSHAVDVQLVPQTSKSNYGEKSVPLQDNCQMKIGINGSASKGTAATPVHHITYHVHQREQYDIVQSKSSKQAYLRTR